MPARTLTITSLADPMWQSFPAQRWSVGDSINIDVADWLVGSFDSISLADSSDTLPRDVLVFDGRYIRGRVRGAFTPRRLRFHAYRGSANILSGEMIIAQATGQFNVGYLGTDVGYVGNIVGVLDQ